MDTAICDAFIKPGKWYKGNLHSHSTASDGSFSPEELADCYREKGYDFIAITDHNKFWIPDTNFGIKTYWPYPVWSLISMTYSQGNIFTWLA